MFEKQNDKWTCRGALDYGREVEINGALEDVSAGAGADGLTDERILRMHAQDDHLRLGRVAEDRARGGDAVQRRHGVVDHDDLRS